MPRRGLFAGRSIGWKLPLMFGGVLLAIGSALSTASYIEVRSSATAIASERLRGTARQLAAAMTGQGTRTTTTRVRALAADSTLRSFLASRDPRRRLAAEAALQRVEARDTTVVGTELLDERGVPILRLGPYVSRLGTPDSAELRRVTAGSDSAGSGVLRQVGDTIVYPNAGLVTAGGRALGYVVQWRRTLPNTRSANLVEQLIGSGATLLFGGGGGAWTDQRGVAEAPSREIRPDTAIIEYQRLGRTRLATALAVPGTPWLLVVEFPRDLVMAPARRHLRRIVLIGLALTMAGLVMAVVFSRRIVRPLQQLTDAAGALSSADYSRRVLVSGDDEMAHLSAAFNTMAERVNDEVAARRLSEEQWRKLFASNPHAMWVFDSATHRFLAINQAAVEQYRYSEEEFLDMRVDQIGPLALPAQAGAPAPAAGATLGTTTHRRKDGALIEVELTSHPLTFAGRAATLVLAHDVTDKVQLEAQLRQAQKMEAVGRLAGGVAHDFNNALAVIMTYAEMLAEESGNGANRRHIEAIQRAATHGHSLSRQLLAFSRRQVLQPVDLDTNAAVTSVELMLRRLIGEDIELDCKLGPNVGQIRMDAGQFEQVLINLAVNARDAMPSGGQLTISTARVDLDEQSARLHGLERGGRFVMVSVADTGLGMTPETRLRIFEPFFTTKEEGKGTGLGLATVYGIITQSGGQISVYSEPGQGSTFRLYLSVVGEAPAPAVAPVPERAAPKGSETVLLVEDDAAVREMVAEVLGTQGYNVLIAPGPADAITLAEHRREQPIDLVVSDVVMPRMDGLALVAKLREMRPGIRALLMSGYTGDVILGKGVDAGVPFIEKPFTVRGLATKVREVLDAP